MLSSLESFCFHYYQAPRYSEDTKALSYESAPIQHHAEATFSEKVSSFKNCDIPCLNEDVSLSSVLLLSLIQTENSFNFLKIYRNTVDSLLFSNGIFLLVKRFTI